MNMTCIHCIHCGKAVTNALPNTTVFRATATCPECEGKLPDVELLQAQVTQLTDERDNLADQLTKARRDIAAASVAFDKACAQRDGLHNQVAAFKAHDHAIIDKAREVFSDVSP